MMNQTIPHVATPALVSSLPRQLQNNKPAVFSNKASQRTISKVRDLRNSGDLMVHAGAVLDPLSAPAFAALRLKIAGNAGGTPLFRCGLCNAPVRVSAGRSGDGQNAYFSHSSQTPSSCAWRTSASIRSVGALQFDGGQEGPDHIRLKNCLAESVRCDPDFSDVMLETIVRLGRRVRKPDVAATFQGESIAFEIQLARLMLKPMVARAKFYQDAGMRLVWITSLDAVVELESQAFRDLYFAAGGRIFTVDQASVQRSEDTNTLHLRELSLEPRVNAPKAIYNRWSTKMVGPDVILMPEVERHGEGQQAYGKALAAQLRDRAPIALARVKSAVAEGQDLHTVAREWEELRSLVGGRDFRQAALDEVPLVLDWLHHVEALDHADTASIGPARQKVARGAMAILRARTGRNWVPLVELVADEWPEVAVALPPEARTLMGRLKSKGGKLHPYHLYHRHMLSALHPPLAFWLLAKSPANRPRLDN